MLLPLATLCTALITDGSLVETEPAREASKLSAPSQGSDEPKHPEDSEPAFDWLLFVDSYGAYNFNEPSRRQEPSSLRAFDVHNGLSIAWAGLNLDFQKKQFGATAQFRFGPSAKTYNSGEDAIGLGFIKQAYATYRPAFLGGKWSLDLGKFDTPYGAEVADSQNNFNYTRGVLNWLGQPFFHTGLRINGELHPFLGLTLIAVNGWNRSLDNNRAKSFGLQFNLHPSDALSVSVGYIAGPENSQLSELQCEEGFVFVPVRGCVRAVRQEGDSVVTQGMVNTRGINRRWRHLTDIVISVQPHPRLELLANADFGYDELVLDPMSGAYQAVMWYGAMLSARFKWTKTLSTSLRGEWFEDPDGATTGFVDAHNSRILTATASMAYAPVPQLLFKFDARHDHATSAMFARGETGFRADQTTLSLGCVVKTK